MSAAAIWAHVRSHLERAEPGLRLAFRRSRLPHPRDAGAHPSIGLPESYQGEPALADYRFPPDGHCRGLHVREYRSFWVAHIDRVHPDCDFVEHLRRDAPGALVGTGAGLGAAIGAALGRTWGAAFAGAGIGILLSALVLADDRPNSGEESS